MQPVISGQPTNGAPDQPPEQTAPRRQREADALRENLLRRKQQARARAAASPPGGAGSTGPACGDDPATD